MRRPGLIFLLALAACGPTGPEGPHLLWSPDAQSLDNPFPDQRLIVGGTAQLRHDWYAPFVAPSSLTTRFRRLFDSYAASMSGQVSGFGNFGPVLLRVSEDAEVSSFSGHVARMVKSGAGWEVLEAPVQVEDVRQQLAQKHLATPDGLQPFFMVRPHRALPEGQEGLLVVTAGVTTVDGRPFVRGRDWDATKPTLGPIAAALGLKESEVLLALPLKAESVTPGVQALAAWADAHPPAITIPAQAMIPAGVQQRPVGVWKSTDGSWATMMQWLEQYPWDRPALDVGQVVVGELAARDLRESEHFRADWVADPGLAPVVPLNFVLTLPKGPKPAGGYKVVIGGHGAGSRNVFVTGDDAFCAIWAQLLAAKGLGCLGIDAVSNGQRGAITNFFAVEDLPAIRDRFREQTFDFLQLESAVAVMDVDGDGTPDLSPRVQYLGNSLGGIMGANFVPVSNRVTSAVLNVPGAGLSNILVSQNIGDLIGLLMVARTDLPFESAAYWVSFPIFRTVAQTVLELGDPINMAGVLPPSRAVLVQEGVGDLTIPNQTTDDLAQAWGLDQPATSLTSVEPLRDFVRIDPARWLTPVQLDGYNGHNVVNDFHEVRDQIVRFLETDGRELLQE